MSREEHGALERRLKELEEEVRKMKEPLERTLMDVRQLISNLENPFNYITKIVDLNKIQPKQVLQEVEHLRKREDIEEPTKLTKTFERIDKGDVRPKTEVANLEKSNLLNILACASILIKLIGQEYAIKFLNSRIVNQLAPRELIDSIIDAVEFLAKYSGVELYVQSANQPSLDSVVAAAYIISLLTSSEVDDRFFILLMFGLRESLIKFKNRGEVP
ncbi:MAG: hypothetical protein N3G77_00910 [Nitrososphaeria archaeon]|nr:hypothetical protein [Nitrososphaeria archaeon]